MIPREKDKTDFIRTLKQSDRIRSLKKKTFSEKRYLSIEQAEIITRVYKGNEGKPVIIKRALSLAQSLREISIAIDPEELIVGNRTTGIRAGVVFPEAGVSWFEKEIETLPFRQQDPFEVRNEDINVFRTVILPYWKGKTLEDDIYTELGDELKAIEKVVKINQKDHAQGHVCPDVAKWLHLGPAGILKSVKKNPGNKEPGNIDFHDSLIIVLEAACDFIHRYSILSMEMSEKCNDRVLSMNLQEISKICKKISEYPPTTFREAIQSVWFLFIILQMESNASSFSPGRMDQYLLPYFKSDIDSGRLDYDSALELIDALFIKLNHIVYLRNAHSARYFAGFPIGFNVVIGGQTRSGEDAVNELSYLFLKAEDHIRLPQPNLTARLHKSSPDEFIMECTRIISLGTGMPQIVNDESIIPALVSAGVSDEDALDYVVVGCVELSTQGNFLGWSDTAMFNLVKVLELTLNNGICLLTNAQAGLQTGYFPDYNTYQDLENAFRKQIDYFIDKMIILCKGVEKIHQIHLPSPFLSSVIEDSINKGIDVTQGGAKYNFSGIQAIQVANIADSMAVLKKLVYEDRKIEKSELYKALINNFKESEILRQICINKAPKYGNDIIYVDNIGIEWITYFAKSLNRYKNYRGGNYHMGLYTVSAHVPMGQNVGATPDGRLAQSPLADGGVSPMYGRDKKGPTAVLNSVSRLPFNLASNGTLLNMKFLPSFFAADSDRENFCSFLKSFVELGIHHIQFNVVKKEDLLKAQSEPDLYRGLTIRVAGYTAYFTELAEDLQNEIIQRTGYGEN